jgi:hypothetical protein
MKHHSNVVRWFLVLLTALSLALLVACGDESDEGLDTTAESEISPPSSEPAFPEGDYSAQPYGEQAYQEPIDQGVAEQAPEPNAAGATEPAGKPTAAIEEDEPAATAGTGGANSATSVAEPEASSSRSTSEVAQVAETTPETPEALPRTAGSLPIIALLGVFALIVTAVFRLFR